MAFDTGAAQGRQSFVRAAFKAALPAVAVAATLAFAAPAAATQYFLDYASMNTNTDGKMLKNGQFVQNVEMAPVNFTAYYGTGNTPQTGAIGGSFTLIGWCVDIYHSIQMGNVDLKYDNTYDLETNSKYTSNTPWYGESDLTDAQIDQVGRLVHYGTSLYVANASANALKLSAIQGAIWTVINAPQGYSFQSTISNTNDRNFVNNWIAKYASADYDDYIPMNLGVDVMFLSETGKYGTKNAHQSFAFVPEPATWALMILGFGGAGAMLRHQRKYKLAA